MPVKADTYDCMERRCPRLGGPVSFHYCRNCPDTGGFCPKTADCWWEYFDVAAYLHRYLSEEELKQLTETKVKPRVASLLEMIQKAMENR